MLLLPLLDHDSSRVKLPVERWLSTFKSLQHTFLSEVGQMDMAGELSTYVDIYSPDITLQDNTHNNFGSIFIRIWAIGSPAKIVFGIYLGAKVSKSQEEIRRGVGYARRRLKDILNDIETKGFSYHPWTDRQLPWLNTEKSKRGVVRQLDQYISFKLVEETNDTDAAIHKDLNTLVYALDTSIDSLAPLDIFQQELVLNFFLGRNPEERLTTNFQAKKPEEVEEAVDAYEEELLGFEYEEQIPDTEESPEKPFDADKIRIEQRMLSLKYIKELLDVHKLELSPGFQRNRVWKDNRQKSLLIESLMLRIPIPAFYFYEDENSNLYVIDGLQRLSTIQDYLDNKFRLTGLQYLGEAVNKKMFSELSDKYVSRIYQTQLNVNIIDARTPSQVKYDIFRRINTGGISLNAQEVRNSIAKTKVRQLLKSLSTSTEFFKATGGGVNDLRMGAQELVLRFIAFYRIFDFSTGEVNYSRGDLEQHLDETFDLLNKATDSELHIYEKAFLKAMNSAYALFGNYAFRSCRPNDLRDGARRKLLNKSLFTTWSVILAHSNLSENTLLGLRKKTVRLLANEIEMNEAYSKALSIGTSATSQVKTNFRIAFKLLKGVLEDD
ncbi:DUF262 domain-containing protein [Acetonema longum]|nr:DUF262 domain-containing protein [Acetonema longum]